MMESLKKSFNNLITSIISVFLISNGLKLVCWLILFFFIPLFFIILAVPLDGSWIRKLGEGENQTVILYGLLLPSKILVYTKNAVEGISNFKDVFSSLVIPLITAYGLKSIDTEEFPDRVKYFLIYLVILLFLSMMGNAMVNAVDTTSIQTRLEIESDNLPGYNISSEELDTYLKNFSDSLIVLKETTSNYVKDCFTYIGLTIGITFKSR